MSKPEQIPDWLLYVVCPKCGGLMTLLKSKSDKWGETVTYQCHNESPYVVMTLTTSVVNKMQPGSFESSYFDWRQVAGNSPEGKPDKFAGVTDIPKNPWTRKTNKSVVFDIFWDCIKYNRELDTWGLKTLAVLQKPSSPALDQTIATLSEWMREETGYIVKIVNGYYTVIGRVSK